MQGEHVLFLIVLMLAGIVATFLYLRYRIRLEYQVTVRLAIDKGQPLTADFLAGLNEAPRRRGPIPHRDLRFGVVAVALGLAIGSFGWLVGEQEVARVTLAVGNVPFLVGVALIALWKFAPRE